MTAGRLTSRLLVVLLLVCAALMAQRRRDPLTDQETDQLRDVAQNPNQRFKLYIKFTEARLLAIDQLRADPKMAADRGQRIHDLLQDVSSLVGEMEDNVDAYDKQAQDMRKGLEAVVQATSEWQLRLRALKEAAANDPEAARESRDYYFVLDTAIDSVNDLADDARQTLREQASKKKH